MTTGIVLAGGRSSRFRDSGRPTDGASKLDANLLGRSVLDRTIEVVLQVADAVVVVGRGSGARADVRYVPDSEAFQGPLAGLAVGLASAAPGPVLALAGDMPLARPDVLRALIARMAPSGVEAAVLADEGDWRPLPVAVRAPAALVAARVVLGAGERSLRAFLAARQVAVVARSDWRAIDPDGDTLFDIDRPSDLVEAERRLTTRRPAREP